MNVKKMLGVAITLALILPAVSAAQDGPVIWLSMLQAKPGQSEALTQNIVANGAELYGQLMAQGAVYEWGVAQPITHTPDQAYSHVEFVVFANWEGVDSFVKGFVSARMAMSPEERTAQAAQLQALVEPGSHFDVVNRGVHVGGASLGRPSYMNLAFFKAKPAADAMGRFQEYVQPILEKLSAEGEIGRFGVEVPELHGDPSWSHVFWYQTPGLGGRDAFHAALQAADEARGEAEAAAMRERWGETFESEAHWDEILAIVHWAGAEGGEGGEGGR